MARKNVALELAKSMNYKEFKKLDFKEQKRLTSILVSAMNKRIKRLGQTEIGRLSPTYQAYERRGNKPFSIKGLKSTDTLFNRFESLAKSIQSATSVREWKTLRKQTLGKLNLEGLSPDDEKAFWYMYRKFQESSRKYKQYRKEISDKILYYIARTFEDKGYDYTPNTRKKIMKFIKDEYEKDKQEQYRRNRERSASVYVSEGDESE